MLPRLKPVGFLAAFIVNLICIITMFGAISTWLIALCAIGLVVSIVFCIVIFGAMVFAKVDKI